MYIYQFGCAAMPSCYQGVLLFIYFIHTATWASTQFSCGEGELAPKPVSTLFQIRREVRLSNVVVRTHHMVQLWEHCLRTLGA